jgi:hypothetical protein
MPNASILMSQVDLKVRVFPQPTKSIFITLCVTDIYLQYISTKRSNWGRAMLALVAIIAGSVITGYSAYKIHALRRGRGRKLRDMEILRRLDIPPKKQVRVWSFLMVLGLVLLTPGLGYLLSIDPISGSGGEAPYSNLRASASSSPTMVPPSEKLDNTPRTLNDEGFSRIFFASSGGGSSKRSSSGGSRTTSASSSSETVTRVDESSGGEDSTTYVSLANDVSEISGAELTSSGPEIDTASETTTKATATKFEDRKGETEPKPIEPLTESAKIDKAPEKISAQGGPEPSKVGGEAEPTPTKSVIVEPETEKETTSGTLGYSVAETVPKSTQTETLTESVTIDVEPEKNTAPDITGDSAVKTVPESNPAETFTEPVIAESEDEKNKTPETSVFSEIGGEPESPSSTISPEPYDSGVESGLPATTPASAASDLIEEPDLSRSTPTIENPATSNISDPPAVPAAKTEPKIDEVKKLEFKEEPTSLIDGNGNDSGEGTEPTNNLLPNLDGPFGDFETGPRLDTFGKGFDFDTEFENFTLTPGLGTRTDKNGTPSSVPIMEFEKIDLGSNFRGGFGLTPASPFG